MNFKWPLGLFLLTCVASCSFAYANEASDSINHKNTASSLGKAQCHKVITLTPELTEITAAVSSEGTIVGTDLYSNYPTYAKKLPKVADFYTIYREKLLHLKYDCIFAGADFNNLLLKTLPQKLNTRVYTFFLRNTNELFSTIRDISNLLGNYNTQGTKLISTLQASIQRTKQEFGRHGALPFSIAFIIWNRPLTVVGGNNHLSEFATICNYQNAFTNLNGFPSISFEQLYTQKVGLVVNLSESKETPVTELGINVIYMSNPDLLMRLTPRAIEEGLPQLCHLLDSQAHK